MDGVRFWRVQTDDKLPMVSMIFKKFELRFC